VIHSLTVEEVAKLIGILSALQEKQQRDQEDADRRMNNNAKGY
jgi:hypothetical protein|tara:strand:+ start:345 stop:473 length:129 start_codon:yes stop_codon:yes gene_type:complete